jgi:hypothetical protein
MDIVSLKRHFNAVFDLYQRHGGTKSIHEFDNAHWKPFGPIVYLHYKIKQVMLNFPSYHPLESELHQLNKAQSQRIQAIQSETDPIKIQELEHIYDACSDTIDDMERELYAFKKKVVKRIDREDRLRLKIHAIHTREANYKNETILYDIRDECRKMASLLEKILSRTKSRVTLDSDKLVSIRGDEP